MLQVLFCVHIMAIMMRISLAIFFSFLFLLGQAGFSCALSSENEETCCCAYEYDCATLKGTCCDVSSQERPFTLSVKVDVPAEPQLAVTEPSLVCLLESQSDEHSLLPVTFHRSSTKLYLLNRSLLI